MNKLRELFEATIEGFIPFIAAGIVIGGLLIITALALAVVLFILVSISTLTGI